MVKLVTLFGAPPESWDRLLTGNCHYHHMAGGGTLYVCYPRVYADCEQHMMECGGKVFPHLHSQQVIGASLAADPLLAGAGLSASDTTYTALMKIMAWLGWDELDPR